MYGSLHGHPTYSKFAHAPIKCFQKLRRRRSMRSFPGHLYTSKKHRAQIKASVISVPISFEVFRTHSEGTQPAFSSSTKCTFFFFIPRCSLTKLSNKIDEDDCLLEATSDLSQTPDGNLPNQIQPKREEEVSRSSSVGRKYWV